jgi:hypothetical protein
MHVLSSKHAEIHSNTLSLPFYWRKMPLPDMACHRCSDMLFGTLKFNPGLRTRILPLAFHRKNLMFLASDVNCLRFCVEHVLTSFWCFVYRRYEFLHYFHFFLASIFCVVLLANFLRAFCLITRRHSYKFLITQGLLIAQGLICNNSSHMPWF